MATPGLLLLGYWVVHWSRLVASMDIRPFSFYERLLTEPRILAEYLALIFFPVRNLLGPFHDDYPFSHALLDPPATLYCLLGWLALIAFALAKRRRFPWLAFAVGWFLVGHLLESTFFNLELYFEHRNYLPSVGPLAALCILLWRLPNGRRGLGMMAFGVYLGLHAFVLHELTTIWGQPRLAAELWLDEHPASERARQQLSQQYIQRGEGDVALKILREGYVLNPKLTGLALQSLVMSCYHDEDITPEIRAILPTLREGERSYAGLTALTKLKEKLSDKPCPGLNAEKMHLLLDAMLVNPKLQVDKASLAELHKLKAGLYAKAAELDPTIQHLETAFEAEPDIDVAMLIIYYLNTAGLYEVALTKIPMFRSRAPFVSILKEQWNRQLDQMETNTVARIDAKSRDAATKK